MALLFQKVPVWLVFALGGVIFLVTLGLFLLLFRRRFGFDAAHGPLLLFMIGSPFFLKNFIYTLGHFDIYGCTAAIGLSLIPARSLLYIVIAMIAAMVLILIHHIHLLMYVPTIALIVVLRHYLVQGVSWRNAILGAAAMGAVGALFLAAQFLGTMAVPEAEFRSYLQSRMADPSRINLLSFSYIWYQPLAKEISDTWQRLPSNLLGLPVFALLLGAAHPALALFRRADRSARTRQPSPRGDRRPALGQRGVSRDVCHGVRLFALDLELGGLPVSDPHAVKALPAAKAVAPIRSDERQATMLGWIVTMISRVGIVRPF